jgi:hypothetical protein
MQKQVAPVHFEDFSGEQFERLCFAFLVRDPEFVRVDWWGQSGGDKGRDIIATDAANRIWVYQCANYARLTMQKVEKDLKKIAKDRPLDLHGFRVIAGGKVSAELKEKIGKAAIAELKIYGTQIWSGPEFEERLRMRAPDLLRRFVEGVSFPEIPAQIRSFAQDSAAATDQDIIVALMRCFDRPAFLTPFHSESSLPRFKLALAETIDALNTGRLPSGVMIPSRHTIQAVPTKAKLAGLVELVVGLRASFDQLVREKQIRPCGCSSPTCDIFMLEPPAARLMDEKRQAILDLVRDIDPSSSIRFYGSQ